MKPLSWQEFVADLYYNSWYMFNSIQRDIVRRDYEQYLFTGKVVDRNAGW